MGLICVSTELILIHLTVKDLNYSMAFAECTISNWVMYLRGWSSSQAHSFIHLPHPACYQASQIWNVPQTMAPLTTLSPSGILSFSFQATKTNIRCLTPLNPSQASLSHRKEREHSLRTAVNWYGTLADGPLNGENLIGMPVTDRETERGLERGHVVRHLPYRERFDCLRFETCADWITISPPPFSTRLQCNLFT